MKKQSLNKWLAEVDYSKLETYTPSKFALHYMNFIKLMNGTQGESNKTPPFHLFMIDKVNSDAELVVNLCFRGAAKTTLLGEDFFFYIAMFPTAIKKLGDISVVIFIGDSMENGAKNLRTNMEHRYNNSDFLQTYIPKAHWTDSTIILTNSDNHNLSIKLYGASTGFRGTKAFGKRPSLVILDDIIPDEAGKSKTLMRNIKDMVYNAVIPALDPAHRKIILSGTPFSSDDVIIEAVESGQWDVNIFPICNKFPCSKKEFSGAWEDRFPYERVLADYKVYESTGKLAGFYQEYMLQINSEEERLVQDYEISWYGRKSLLQVKDNFNFYITTDFATSAKQQADFSVISVWAYNNNGDWFWVDGICEKQTLDKSIDNLFSLVQLYKPISVGIEVTGQQGGFIDIIKRDMITRNIFFNIARSGKNNTILGIRPDTDKLTRFNLVVPLFKMGKMYFPEELKPTKVMSEFMLELSLATKNGIKGHDDCIDTISMLAYMKPWKPSIESEPSHQQNSSYFGIDDDDDMSSESSYNSYIV